MDTMVAAGHIQPVRITTHLPLDGTCTVLQTLAHDVWPQTGFITFGAFDLETLEVLGQPSQGLIDQRVDNRISARP